MGFDAYIKKRISIDELDIHKSEISLFDTKGRSINLNKTDLFYIDFELISFRNNHTLNNWIISNIGNNGGNEYELIMQDLINIIEMCKEDIKYLNSLKYDPTSELYILPIDEEKINLSSPRDDKYDSSHFYLLEDMIVKLSKLIPKELTDEDLYETFIYQASY